MWDLIYIREKTLIYGELVVIAGNMIWLFLKELDIAFLFFIEYILKNLYQANVIFLVLFEIRNKHYDKITVQKERLEIFIKNQTWI